MVKTGLLILTNPAKIAGLLPAVLKHVNNTLYIHWNPHNKTTEVEFHQWPIHSQTVGRIYYQASVYCQQLDVRVLLSGIKNPSLLIETRRQIDILLCDRAYNEIELTSLKNRLKNIETRQCPVVTLADDANLIETPITDYLEPTQPTNNKVYENVVLGGTFDRLHNGHKILLNEALLRCTKQLTVGVTDTNMLLSKKLWELIQPCQERIQTVQDYLEDIDPSISHDVVAIQDPFGPTKHDPSFQMIVVSAETLMGGKKVNEMRILNKLRTLDIHTISLISNGLTMECEEDKISSSNYRMRLLGTRIREPKSKFDKFPYIIGLTGGIASGKSTVGERLSKLGAALIDCDKMAHELYQPGTKLNEEIVKTFGKNVANEKGEINRKVLGSIVFNDKNQLEKLNNLLWPAMAEICIERVNNLYNNNGYKIVIVEAAVLLQAGWDRFCNEVWACIIPPEEAVRRLMTRNNLTEEDARSRLAAQPSNCDYVNAATIVFSTFWSPNFTQKQVETAWKILEDEILSKSDDTSST